MIIMLMNKRFSFLFVLIFFFFGVHSVLASEESLPFFTEEFSDNYADRWEIFNNDGQIFQDSTGLHLISTNGKNFPFLTSKNNIFPDEGNYEIVVEYSYPTTTNFGTGFGFGNLKPPYALSNYSNQDLFRRWVYFYVWQGINDQHSIYFRNCDSEMVCNSDTTRVYSSSPSVSTHTLIVRSVNNNFDIKIDGVTVNSNLLLNSNRRPNVFWIGNPITLQTNNSWSTLIISKISVFKLVEKVVEKNVVILLPGFAGSWDVPAILSGQPGINWKIPPFVKEYDGIINSLTTAGYEQNKDFYVFPYDWRKNLDNLADDLNSFIASKNITQRKIDIVGHSMGGLVARTYLQKYGSPMVNKVVTAGSPHKGIIDAYGLWEGATVWDAVWWQKVLLEIASEVNRQPGETKIQAVRRIAPSVKDLMPTENYLKNNAGHIPWANMSWKNDYLANKNDDVTNFLTKIVAGGSQDYANTRKVINVENPSNDDKLQGLWQDGKPKLNNTFDFGLGDGFVTNASSTELFNNRILLSGGHGETISFLNNIKKILSEIKVATESAVGSSSDSRKSAFVAKLNSPGKLHVCLISVCDENLGLVFDSEKMVIVPGYSNTKYTITVDSAGELGKYKLLVGEVNNGGIWKSVGGNLTSSTQKDTYQYNTQTDQVSTDTKTIENLLKTYWNKKLKLSEIYGIRQSILEAIDKNIKEVNYTEFDTNLSKWQTLDYYVASEYTKDKYFGHDGWDIGLRKGKKSKYLQKTPNYFSASLVQIIKDKTAEYESVPYWQLKLKIDKMIQLVMLKTFTNF